MPKKESSEDFKKEEKISAIANAHVTTNVTFLFVAVTLLTFVVTIKNELFLRDQLLLTQLGISIILFAYSIFARSKLIGSYNRVLSLFGKYSFTIGFVAFMNSLGIIISALILKSSGIIFLSIYAFMMLAYGAVSSYTSKISGKKVTLTKEIASLVVLIVFGLLHIINSY
ncbi:hypothetical protein KA107_00855 [Candidatus Pacearchaeota archaeon]|nr:hypothetical protein [Candidatus Pacearchaeota archaeon]